MTDQTDAAAAVPAGSLSGDRTPTPSRRGGNRLSTYVRQVVAELRKVIWPTRNELVTYTTVVIVFVLVMTAIVGGLDYGFTQAVLHVFGRG